MGKNTRMHTPWLNRMNFFLLACLFSLSKQPFFLIPAHFLYFTNVFVYISCNTLYWGVHDRYTLGGQNSSASLNKPGVFFFFLDIFILKSLFPSTCSLCWGGWCAAAWAVFPVSFTCDFILFGNNCTSEVDVTKSAINHAFLIHYKHYEPINEELLKTLLLTVFAHFIWNNGLLLI